MYAARQALFVHAVASPYRDRSHFDGQNVLETGGTAPTALKDGWMNRLLGLLPAGRAKAIAFSATVPMALRGARGHLLRAVGLPSASDDLLARVGALYAQRCAAPRACGARRCRPAMMAGDCRRRRPERRRDRRARGAAARRRERRADRDDRDRRLGHALAASAAASPPSSRLDPMLAALKTGLGADWANTLVLVATEFGRTAAANGTGGTDHGTGLGGDAARRRGAGGRVLADWPGLSPAALYEGRDLKPTTDLDALIAGALAQHYGLEPGR